MNGRILNEIFFLFFADLTLNESDSSIQESERALTIKWEDKMSDFIEECTTLIDENGNVLRRSLTTMTKTSPSDLTTSDTSKNLISKEESSGLEKMQSAKLVSSQDGKKSSGTFLEQEITSAISNQGIGSEEQNKCKTYIDNHPWVLGTYY